jgi:ABC-2 type transport system ATP-binding protein
VTGFLGPNGSGKTTTLRALLGLVHADGGNMRILGTPSTDYLHVAHRVGAIVESPAFFGNLSGQRTLELLAMAGGVPRQRVEEALVSVGLRDRGTDLVKSYSLGMKQRLAVASALLKQPELLILDEPANGLDPAGIHEMRSLVRELASRGVTILISSHLLAEIEQVCDSMTIISQGRRVTHGPVAQVLAQHDKGEYSVRVADPAGALEALVAAGGSAQIHDGALIVSGVTDAAWITQTLGAADHWLTELTALTPDLESVFLDVTGTRPGNGHMSDVDDAWRPPAPSKPAPIEIEVTK